MFVFYATYQNKASLVAQNIDIHSLIQASPFVFYFLISVSLDLVRSIHVSMLKSV